MLAFQITPPAIADLWLERLAANGIDELRTSDPSNTPHYWRQAVDGAKRAGLKTILNIIYSISPKHTDEYFVERAREAAKLDVDADLFQRSRRVAHARGDAPAGAADLARSERQAGGVPHPLQHRPRAALLPRSDPARHLVDQHGDSAARRRLVESLDLQRRDECPRARLQNPWSTKKILKPVRDHFADGSQAGEFADGQAARIRCVSSHCTKCPAA